MTYRQVNILTCPCFPFPPKTSIITIKNYTLAINDQDKTTNGETGGYNEIVFNLDQFCCNSRILPINFSGIKVLKLTDSNQNYEDADQLVA